MRSPPLLTLVLLSACAAVQTPDDAAAAPSGDVLREAELARVRCLLVAPLENGSDAPRAAAAATTALLSHAEASPAQVLPIEELRTIFADTPLELSDGVAASTAVELAELLGADAALYGAVEGRGHGASPDLMITLRLALAGRRDVLFAAVARVQPQAGESIEAAVRRTVIDATRPVLDRLGAGGRASCFPRERREALRSAALSLRPPSAPTPSAATTSPAVAEPPSPGPPPAHPRVAPVAVEPAAAPREPTPRPALRSQRQRDLARVLDTTGRLTLPDVAFAGRTAELARDAGLVDLAQVLAAAPGLEIRLQGYTDATGDAAGDLRLSAAMAQAAQRRLIDLGVDPARIAADGRGGENPLLPNFTARGRAGNRRVEVILAR